MVNVRNGIPRPELSGFERKGRIKRADTGMTALNSWCFQSCIVINANAVNAVP